MLYQIPIQVAAMVLVAVLTARLVTISLKSRTDDLTTQVSELRLANGSLTAQLAHQPQPGPTTSALPEQQAPGGSSEPAGEAPLTLSDGGRTLRFDSRGYLDGGGLIPPGYVRLVSSVLNTGRLSVPSALLRPLGGQTRSAVENDAFQLLAPVGVVTFSDDPAFRWTPLKEAENYSVMVRDVESDEQVEGEIVSRAEWVPEKPLKRGHTYSWVVVATLSGGKRLYVPGTGSPPATFKILDKSASDELERARGRSKGSHILMAVLYSRAGMVAEAQNELTALQWENPRSSLVARLQRSLRDRARR